MIKNNVHAKNVITRNSVSSNVQVVIGYFIAIIFGLTGIIGCASSGIKTRIDAVMVTILFAFMAIGILLVVRGKKRKKLIKLFKEYAARLAADPQRSIDKLAAAAGASVESIKKNISIMIHKGYFVGAYIDHTRNCLMFAQEGSLYEQKSIPAQEDESPAAHVCISCPGCGAKNKMPKGTVGECEFCGSYLSQG